MYIRTRQVKLHCEKGWWGLIENPRLDFDIQLSPQKLGPSGRKTIRAWTREGMCDAPTGRLSQIWRTLMQINEARYIATCTSSSVEIEVFDQDLFNQLKYGRKFKNVEAKMKLMQAAQDTKAYSQLRINAGGRNTDLDFSVEGTQAESRMSIDYWGNGWAIGAVSPWAFVDMFKAEFGPPVRDAIHQNAIFEDMEKEITVRCMLIPVAATGKGGPRTYYKTFARRLTK